MIVDCHTHFVPRRLREQLLRGEVQDGFSARGSDVLVTPGGLELPVGYAELHEPEAKLERLDALGIDAAVVSITPHLFTTDAGFAARANEDLATYVAASPRLFGQATLPLTLGEPAARELERAVSELGHVGAILGTGPFEAATLDPVLEVAQALGAVLTLHPHYTGPVQDHRYFFANSLGVPLDTTLAAAWLIASGALDRFPRVRILLAHGGGYLPLAIGRLDNAYAIKDEARADSAQPPSAYLSRFAYDTVLHDARALRFVADVVGEDRLVLGTDAPYATGQVDPCAFVRSGGLDPETLGVRAAAFFGLSEAASG